MPAIKLTGFSGEQPRLLPRLMPDQAAQAALNTRLDDGGLTPIRRSAQIATVESDATRTIYLHQGVWLAWDSDVNAAPGPVAQDRLYFTGDGVPKMRVGGIEYNLAVPRPPTALDASLGGTGEGDVTTRLYVYTWVTDFGEESEPSPASDEIDWQPGNTVLLTGFALTPPERSITRQRIYRSQTGQSGTWFYLIADRAAGTTDFTDDVAVDAFQEPLPSANWNAPPDGLQGLTALPNGMMAGFVGRDLYFCEPWRPHAWPEKYVLTMDYPIVGLGALGTSVVVATTGTPYIVTGSSPDTMVQDKLELNLPCINARGIVDLGFAIAYPSHEGLVVVAPGVAPQLVTGNIFNRDGWLALNPANMVATQYSGRYVAFYATTADDGSPLEGMLVIDLSSPAFLIRSDTMAEAAHYDVASGGTYFVERGTRNIRRFDAPNASRRLQYWKSKEFILPYPENFGVIRIDAEMKRDLQSAVDLAEEIAQVIATNQAMIDDDELMAAMAEHDVADLTFAGDTLLDLPADPATFSVGVYADRKLIATVTRTNQPVRLPTGFRARVWEIDVFGDIQVEQIVMAKTMDELRMTP